MMEEIIKIKSARLKPLKDLLPQLGNLGFTKVSYSKEALIIEKVETENLSGKPYLFYSVELLPSEIIVRYALPSPERRLSRSLEMGQLCLNLFRLLSGYYEISAASIYPFYYSLLASLSEALEKEKLQAISELSSLRMRYDSLEKKYKDLVRSSEQNARILVEADRKAEELSERIKSLEGVTDEVLQERLFEWIRTHSGEINIFEFARFNSIPVGRVEQGLDMLIRNGYIKRRA
ncbi:MAG: hypothetical protein QXH30_02195 [Candidatus Bilamarchaeaceae archaeon]